MGPGENYLTSSLEASLAAHTAIQLDFKVLKLDYILIRGTGLRVSRKWTLLLYPSQWSWGNSCTIHPLLLWQQASQPWPKEARRQFSPRSLITAPTESQLYSCMHSCWNLSLKVLVVCVLQSYAVYKLSWDIIVKIKKFYIFYIFHYNRITQKKRVRDV